MNFSDNERQKNLEPGEKALQGNWYLGLLVLIMIISDRLWVHPVAPTHSPPPQAPKKQRSFPPILHKMSNLFRVGGEGSLNLLISLDWSQPLWPPLKLLLSPYTFLCREHTLGYLESCEESPELFEEWKKRTIEASPLFHYRHLVVELGLLC